MRTKMNKFVCGYYKGFRILQEYIMIGPGCYGDFYPCIKKGSRYYKIKEGKSDSIKDVKKYIDNIT